jgi:hypothetical protein
LCHFGEKKTKQLYVPAAERNLSQRSRRYELLVLPGRRHLHAGCSSSGGGISCGNVAT